MAYTTDKELIKELTAKVESLEKKSKTPANTHAEDAASANFDDSRPYMFTRLAQYTMTNGQGSNVEKKSKYERNVDQKIRGLYNKAGANFAFAAPGGTGSYLAPVDSQALMAMAEEFGDQKDLNDAGELIQRVKAGLTESGYVTRSKSGAIGSVQNTLIDQDGGVFRQPVIGDFIEQVRNQDYLTKLGVTNITLPPSAMLKMPKGTKSSVAYWLGESQGLTQSQMNFGYLNLQAKKLAVLTSYTYEMIQFANPQTEALLRDNMATSAALELGSAALYGTGDTRPRGLFNYETTPDEFVEGVDKVFAYPGYAPSTNGNPFQPEDLALMQAQLPEVVMESLDGFKMLMRPKMLATIKNLRVGSGFAANDGKGSFAFSTMRLLDGRLVDTVDGIPVVTSRLMLDNEVKGTSTNLSSIILGKWSDMVLARAAAMEFVSSNVTLDGFTNDKTYVRCIQHVDTGLRRLSSFATYRQLLQQ